MAVTKPPTEFTKRLKECKCYLLLKLGIAIRFLIDPAAVSASLG